MSITSQHHHQHHHHHHHQHHHFHQIDGRPLSTPPPGYWVPVGGRGGAGTIEVGNDSIPREGMGGVGVLVGGGWVGETRN